MDDVRAMLVVLPESPLPAASDAEGASALILVPPADESDYKSAGRRAADAVKLGAPVYLVLPPLASGQSRAYLRQTLQPGVYGVAVQTAASVDQLRYLEGLLEEQELRARDSTRPDRDRGWLSRPARDQHHARRAGRHARIRLTASPGSRTTTSSWPNRSASRPTAPPSPPAERR